jgi:hypothetical protein
MPEVTNFLEFKVMSQNFIPTWVRGFKYTEVTAKDGTAHIHAAGAYTEGVEA